MDVVLDGFLLKSPPVKRFCKAKWRERWFVLKHSGHIPGQFVLEYYTDSTCRKLKGRIDLDQCEQVDSGLPYDNPKTNHQHMFNIHTPKRKYFLVARTEVEMSKWVDCICSVCGLKIRVDEELAHPVEPTSTVPVTTAPSSVTPTPAPSTTNLTSINSESSPYIPISECITGKPLNENSNGISRFNEPRPHPPPTLNHLQINSILSNVPPPPPKSPRPQETSLKTPLTEATSDEFYDHPKPVGLQSHNGRTSPEPNLDDMYKVPPVLKRQVKEKQQNWEGGFSPEDDSMPLCPPRVNWKTYPLENGPPNSTYDVPVNHATLYDVPPSHTVTVNPPGNQTDPYDVPVNHRDPYDVPVSNASMSRFDKKLDFDATDSDAASPLLPGEEVSIGDVVAPPRPPKPRNLGDKKKSESDSASLNSLTLYDTPASAKGVFLSKQMPAEVFAFMKDDKELVDLSSLTRVPLSGPSSSPHQEMSTMDDMYDFPRLRSDNRLSKKVPLQQKMITSSLRRPRQHTYTNAAPGLFSGKDTVMNYEYRPSLMNKEPTTPAQVVEGAVALSDDTNSPPPLYSPSMAAESTYSNIGGSMDDLLNPPAINRNLKPKKKLSDSSDPGYGPFNLAPPPALIPGHAKCSFRKQRAAPSPTPSGSGLSGTIPSIPHRPGHYTDQSSSEDDHSSSGGGSRRNSNDDQVKHFLSPPAPYKIKAEIQYLDLDLDNEASAQSPKSPDRDSTSTVYKTVDFVKTKALNDVKQNVNETYRKNQ